MSVASDGTRRLFLSWLSLVAAHRRRDWYGAALEGLWKAAETYDELTGVPFERYASRRIGWAVRTWRRSQELVPRRSYAKGVRVVQTGFLERDMVEELGADAWRCRVYDTPESLLIEKERIVAARIMADSVPGIPGDLLAIVLADEEQKTAADRLGMLTCTASRHLKLAREALSVSKLRELVE